jgi:hypothetical protein
MHVGLGHWEMLLKARRNSKSAHESLPANRILVRMKFSEGWWCFLTEIRTFFDENPS